MNIDFSLCVHYFICKYLYNYCVCLPLNRVGYIKYFGVHLNYRLKFVEHIYFANNLIRK